MLSHRARWFLVALAILAVAPLALPARAQELLPPQVTVRKFPQFTYCPIPVDMSFIANGTSATVRISTTTVNFINSNDNNNQHWSHMSIDNVCVAPDDAYLAHLGPIYSTSGCYNNAPVGNIFLFNHASGLPLDERFSTEPGASGWDLTHHARWYQTRTAPNDPDVGSSQTPPGSLELGTEDQTALSDSAFTTVTVHGLVRNTTYHLTFWWTCEDMEEGKLFVTASVMGDGSTPVAHQTWGMLKRRYE